MSERARLFVLWTNGDPVTSEKMVFMYTVNSL
ncbi:MAG TPA: DsrE family protein, partial [Thermodesulforhabdus norvegica]|nr:DsrE family protein [Thermodesulforhabdus norvegica]